jgi:hypothetical protein
MSNPPSDRRGTVAVVLAIAVGASVVILAAGAAWAIVDKGLTVPTEVASLLSTALGALIGAVAAYLGLRVSESPVERRTGEGEGKDMGATPPSE